MKKNKVKSIIRESIYNLLNEYSSEQRLPFDDDKFKNKNYLEQYTDWLEDFGKYGKLPSSKMDFWDELRKAIQVIFSEDLRNRAGLSLGDDDDAERAFKELHEKIAPYIRINSNGNIYIERAIGIDELPEDYNSSDENGQDPMQLYNSLVKNYNNNVGGCWAFKEGAAEAYCSEGENAIILFKGYIRVEDIDIIKTALLIYNYGEFEFRTKPNAKVELFEVLFDDSYNNKTYRIPLRGTLIVSASYFGNHGKYNGEYAPIDDGFGSIKQIVDRKGDITYLQDMIKKALKEKIPLTNIFDDVKPISDNFTAIHFGYWTFIDKYGNLINNGNTWFLQIGNISEGFVSVETYDGLWAFISPQGKQIGDGYEYVHDFHNGFAKVENEDGQFSFINTQGQQIGDWYDEVSDFHNGFAKVENEDGQFSFINTQGRQIGDWYYKVGEFQDGLAKVENDDEESFINTQGQQIGDWYRYVSDFENGLAKVMQNNKWSLINTQGQQICDWYDEISDFENGLAKVKRNYNKWSLINTQGQQICDWYDEIDSQGEFFYVVNNLNHIAIVKPNEGGISPWFNEINFPSNNDIHQNVAIAYENDDEYDENDDEYNENDDEYDENDESAVLINSQGQIISDRYPNIDRWHTIRQYFIASNYKSRYLLLDYNGKPLTHWFDKNHPAKVKIDGKIYFIADKYNCYNEQGEKVNPPESKIEQVIEAKKTTLSNLISEALHTSIRNYLLYN